MKSSDFDRLMRQAQRLRPLGTRSRPLGKFPVDVVPADPKPVENYTLRDGPQRPVSYEPADSRVRVLGLDLGQMRDPAAAVMISRRKFDTTHPARVNAGVMPPREAPVEVELIHEWPKGTDYSKLVDFCLNLHEFTVVDGVETKQPVKIDVVVFDMTGCGHPFRDFFLKTAREVQFRSAVVGVNLSSSDTALKVRSDARGKFMTVAKLEMLTAINIFAQRNLITYPKGWSTQKLFEQMQTFQVRKTAASNITFEQGGPGHHGDAVIALGLACWYLQRGFRELAINTLPPDEDTLLGRWPMRTTN